MGHGIDIDSERKAVSDGCTIDIEGLQGEEHAEWMCSLSWRRLQRSCWLLHPIQTQIVRLVQLEAAPVEAAESGQHWTLRLGGRD